MSTTKNPKATSEMKKFQGEWNVESNKFYQKSNLLEKRVEELNGQIGEATIGYGLAIKKMSEYIEQLKKDLQNLKETRPDFDNDFREKFGKRSLEFDWL